MSTSESRESWKIPGMIKKSLETGTIENVLAYIKEKIGTYKSSEHVRNQFSIEIEKPENYTDENIELFGDLEKIERFGNTILKNEEYLKNYQYIKEHYGQMDFSYIKYSNIIKVLSDENVKKMGYENIFKFFNHIDSFERQDECEKKLRSIPEDMTKEKLDKIIEVYGDIPEYKGFYNEKIVEAIQKAKRVNQEINLKNEWLSDEMLYYIIENEMQDNIVTILNTNMNQFNYKEYGRRYLDFRSLKLMTPEILGELGEENVGKIAKSAGIEILLEAKERNLLGKWKSKIDSAEGEEKSLMFSLKSILLLEQKNDDLSLEEIEMINYVLSSPRLPKEHKNQIEEICRDHPEYIRLLEIPTILLAPRGRYREGLEIKKDLEDISAKFEEFQKIKEIIGNENFIKLINEKGIYSSDSLYGEMQQAYQNHTLENWKKLLEYDDTFIPNELAFLDEHIFIQNSLESITQMNKLDWESKSKLVKIIEDYPKCIMSTYNIEELLKFKDNDLNYLKGRIIAENIDEKITSMMQDESVSNHLKEFVKGVLSENIYTDESITGLIDKGEKFERVVHFIPTPKVVKKYPEEQIEKFNKKIWFNLARNELYNHNDDTKNSLVEAVLSLGIFEKDDKQEERLGMLQKFATYIPKEKIIINNDTMNGKKDFIEEHFEIVNKEVTNTNYNLNLEKLLKDPNILSLFHSKEEAEEELSKLNEWYSQDYMENVLQKEYVNKQYKDIMEYIYQFGYDRKEEYNYTIKLKTDIQQLKSKDKKKGQEVENRIRDFYFDYAQVETGIMTPHKLHRIFDGMDMTYKEGFYQFFKDNLEYMLKDPKKQSEISKIQKQWEDIVAANLGQKITFEKCESYLTNHRYNNIQENEQEIAKLSSMCGYSQEEFDEIKEIFAEQLKRTKSSIPQIEQKNEKNGYSYKVLKLDDPMAIFVGELTDCCQALRNAGESCMRHSVTSPNGRVLVVQDEKGKVLSQSWIWRNKNVLCFDNIEAVDKDSNNKKIVSSEILDMVKKAAREFVETDKKSLSEWKTSKITELEHEKESGNITEEQYKAEIEKIEKIVKGQQLTRVTVGIGYTDINLKGLKKDKENRYPEEKVEYIDDSRTQLVLYEDNEFKNEKTNLNTLAIYSDSEESARLVDIDTSEIEIDEEYDEEYDDYDEEYDEEYDDEHDDENLDDEQRRERNSKINFVEEVYQVEEKSIDGKNEQDDKISLEDIRKTVNHVVGRNQARQAIENIRRILRNER